MLPNAHITQSSYTGNAAEFVYDVKQHLRNSSVWPHDFACPHQNTTTNESKSSFSFTSESIRSDFSLVHQSVPSINQSNGYLYVGDKAEPSCGQGLNPNTTINLGITTESLSSTAGNMRCRGCQAVSPVPSDPRDPPSHSCSVSADEQTSVHNQHYGVDTIALSPEGPVGDGNNECVVTPMGTGGTPGEASVFAALVMTPIIPAVVYIESIYIIGHVQTCSSKSLELGLLVHVTLKM